MNIWNAEPAMVVGVVTAVLVLLTSFGVPISEDQRNAIVGVVSAILVLVAAVVVRSQVTPVKS